MALLGNSKVNEVLYAKSLQIENNGSLGHGYCICDTPAATAAKVITIDNYSPVIGGLITVKFTYSVPGSATLNISNTGAKPIRFNGAAVKAALIRDGDTVSMVYDGTAYNILSILPFDRLWGRDTRAVASPPSYYMDYSAILTSEFKSGTSINSPLGNSGYSHLLTLAPWGDSSGGYPTQIAVPSNADSTIAFRRGTSNTDWGAWKGLATQDWVEAKGYKTTDNNTWRPITVGGTKLTDTASLTITAGDNVTLTATAAGTVSIAAKNTTYGTVTKDAAGLVPKLTAGTTKATSAYRIFASVDGSTTPNWYQLPDNAFKNDNTVTKVGTSTSDAATGTVLLAGAGNINVTKADNVITIKNDFNISDYSKVGHTHTNMVTGSSLTANAVILGGGSSAVKALAAGSAGQVLALNDSKVPYWKTLTDNDSRVTSATNHYAPTAVDTAKLTANASSTTAASWNSTQLVTGVTLTRDDKGHVTGLSVSAVKMPANPNSNSTTHLYIGASGTAANGATSNGATYLKLYDDSTSRHSYKISGTQNVSVASDASGNLTITGPNLSGYATTGHTHDQYALKAGDTFTGTVTVSGGASINTKGYVTGTWLATTAATDLGSKPERIAVIGTAGTAKNYIYWRSPAEILSDIGAAASGHAHAEYLPLDGSKAMTGRLVINKVGTGQSDSAAGHIALQKSGTEYAHIRLTASNSNLAIESKGGIILYSGAGDSSTEFSSSNYVGFYAGKVNASGTVDLNGFRNLGLSGTITHGNATITLPSSTGTLALTTHSHTNMVTGSSLTANAVILGNGSSTIKALAAGTAGQVLTLDSNKVPIWKTPTAIEAYTIKESDWTTG